VLKGTSFLSGSIIFVLLLYAPRTESTITIRPDLNLQTKEQWVDSLINLMSVDQKICQLICVRANSDKGPESEKEVADLVQKYQVGGICFFQGTPVKQAQLTNYYQSLSNIPLMVSMDAEWGLGMRLKDSVMSFPKQLTLGAIKDDKLIKDMGLEIATQLKRLGVHVNFAPVADINNNAVNPVINVRSFGESRTNVALKALAYMHGLQEGNIIACAKHFPGHGDTEIDSHLDLPVLTQSRQRLDSMELFPFAALINQGVKSIMVGHLNVPSIDDEKNIPASLSPKAINQLLVQDMGFKGLIFTDGLEMKSVIKDKKPGEVEAEALVAGNDILLLPHSIPDALQAINAYIADGKFSIIDLNKKVRKILEAKYQLGLSNFRPVDLFNLYEDLNLPSAISLKRTLIENAITLVRDKENMLPIMDISKPRVISIALGNSKGMGFQNTLGQYINARYFSFTDLITDRLKYSIITDCRHKDYVIISLHGLNNNAKINYGLSNDKINLVNEIAKYTKVILVNFGSPYVLKYFDNIATVIQAYEDDSDFQDLAAQLIFGGSTCKGNLPVTASNISKFGSGLTINKTIRVGYDIPERAGINSTKLSQIDLLANDAVNNKATPGCQIVIIKDGKVIYKKAFGYFTYEKKTIVTNQSIYDIASITKIAATTISIMKLQEKGKLNIEDGFGRYLEELACTNKEYILLKDAMTHRAGLRSWIPFYESTMMRVNNRPFPSTLFYSRTPDRKHMIKVLDSLYLVNNYKEKIWDEIVSSDLPNIGEYRYSDLGFYMLAETIHRVTGTPIDQYVFNNFYKTMGLRTLKYKPLNYFKRTRIVPSERDNYFRMNTVQGYVHDMGAAMLGGVSGHAGLFSNASDLAVLMQMLLNKGSYGGIKYLNPETVKLFTTRSKGSNRRGIGFDLGVADKNIVTNLSKMASEPTFGHTGFTGTCAWADPEKNIVYVFLSNRTYPSSNNWRLAKGDYRERIQTAIYEAAL